MYRKSFTASNADSEAYADAFSGKHLQCSTSNLIIKSKLQVNQSHKAEDFSHSDMVVTKVVKIV